jgi:purine-binding chemotaxis protein CheW
MAGSSAEQVVLLFHFGGRSCAVPIEAVQEIAPYAAMTRVPGQPSLLMGFLNLRGRAIPVIQLAALFGLPDVQPALSSAIIILKSQEGWLVDHVAGLASPAPDGCEPVDAGLSFNDCAAGQCDIDGHRFTLLAPERVLLAEEQARIAELARQAGRRIAELADTET